MSYKVTTPAFEGPFDLLVHLIKNAEMDIYDIRIAEITKQYIDYISATEEMDFNMGAEFMVLAATLLDIKSKMILPRAPVPCDEADAEDPRRKLVDRLIEYKRFRRAAEILKECEETARSVFEKPQEDISEFSENPTELLSLDMKQFTAAFSLFLRKRKKEKDLREKCSDASGDEETIENRMAYIRSRFGEALQKGVDRLGLRELVPDKKDRYDIVVTFVSVLQMMREKYLDACQESIFGDITVIMGTSAPGGEDHEGQENHKIRA